MAVKCRQCPLRQFDCFLPMSESEAQTMQKFKAGELVVEPHTPILMEGANSPQLFTALRGMGLRYKLLADGKRQVINLVFPGDFLGLQAGLLGEMKHSIEATTRMTLCVFDRTEFWSFFKANPDRAFDVTWLAAVEEHFLGASLLSIGQRSARQRIAWALLRIYRRGAALDLLENGRMPLPIRQQDLADALGLSLVHTNKTLAILRERQLANWSEGMLTISSLDGLEDMALIDEDDHELPRPLI